MFEERLAYLQDVYRITGRKFGYFMTRVANNTLTSRAEAPSAASSRWNLEYEPDFVKGRKLYEVAKRKSWNPVTDVDWSLSPTDLPLIKDEYWAVADIGLADVLTDEERLTLNRQERAWLISQLLHGEQGSLLLCAQLVDMRPDLDGKLFLASQVMDEARHVEVFRTYLDQLQVYPVDLNVKFIIDSLLGTPNWHKKAIGMLVLIEGYALGVFNYTKRSNLDPCLDTVLDFVMQDEGRHVGFGIDSIAQEVNQVSEAERRELENYAFSLCRTLFFGRERGGFRSLVKLYWDTSKGRTGLNETEFNQKIAHSRVMNDFQYEVFHNQLMANLQRIGLLTDRMKPQYQALGFVVN